MIHGLAITSGTILSVLYIWLVAILVTNRPIFQKYARETSSMLLNGLIGILGIVLNILNVLLIGFPVQTIEEIVDSTNCECNKTTAKQQLIAFTVISCFRFICWYAEFLTSFFFIAFFQSRPIVIIMVRYLIHTLNTIFSTIALIMVCSVYFPLNYFHNHMSFSPIITQCILVIYSILSYYLIVTSTLYKLTLQPNRHIRWTFRS